MKQINKSKLKSVVLSKQTTVQISSKMKKITDTLDTTKNNKSHGDDNTTKKNEIDKKKQKNRIMKKIDNENKRMFTRLPISGIPCRQRQMSEISAKNK